MKKRIYLTSLLILFITPQALASAPALFGFGSRASGMAGSFTGVADDAFGWYYNPAGPAQARDIELQLGFTSGVENLRPFNGVVVRGDQTKADVPADYENTLGPVIGATIPILKNRLSIGLNAFIPAGALSRVSNIDKKLPSYIFYNDRTQRPTITAGMAWHPLEWFSLGAGIITGTTIGGTIFTDLNEGSGQSVIEVHSTKTPVLGMKFMFKEFDLGISYRGENAGRTKIKIEGDGPIPFEYISQSVSFFDPHEISLGLGCYISSRWLVSTDITWANWARYIPPINYGAVTTPRVDPPTPVATNFRNTVTARIGSEYKTALFEQPLALRVGYAYAPTPVPFQVGESNFVDNDKHIAAFGVGANFNNILGWQIPLSADAHFQYQYLTPNEVVKNNPQAIGGPSYISGGSIYNFGLTLGTKI